MLGGGGVGRGERKGRVDEAQKTAPVEIKRDDEEEERHGAQKCFNELNEVIRSKALIVQNLITGGGGGALGAGCDADERKTQDRMFVTQEPFNSVNHNVRVRRPLGRQQTGSVRTPR